MNVVGSPEHGPSRAPRPCVGDYPRVRAIAWELAVCTTAPGRFAACFAQLVGQCYDRTEFDVLARRVHGLDAAYSADQARLFRSRLDQRLRDRYRAPVAWATPVGTEPAVSGFSRAA